MISRLEIENYALIDKSIIDFKDGFTVITGETGAGKSIMLDALGLLMGARADTKAIASKDRKMIVEASFTRPPETLKKLFDENDLSWDPSELIIRREITPSGKSRGFVNDTPVNLTMLARISDSLIDIHSQHNNYLLNDPHRQLLILDSFSNNQLLLQNYKTSFISYVNLRNRLKDLKETIAKGKENKEYIKFRLEQLEKLKPKNGELSELEKEFEILSDADRIKEQLVSGFSLLSGGNSSVLKQLQNVAGIIETIDFTLLDSSENENISDRLNSLKIELRDISDTLEGYYEKIDSDPDRLEKVKSRIESIYDAMKHFKVKDEEELVELHENLKKELQAINVDNKDLTVLEQELKERAKELKERAELLTQSRLQAAEKFSSRLIEKISPLGLPNINFNISVEKGKMTTDGQDVVTFNCSFNKNHPLQPLSSIASGGEMSRVMLGIKSIMAETMKLPTIIFDEIDTGVSGEIAHKMGYMMKQMAETLQLMSVTHLPQVAALGQTHLKVYKADDSVRTISRVKELSREERINEIASMLSGNKINPVALENARILIENN